jgi:hypothetical protein
MLIKAVYVIIINEQSTDMQDLLRLSVRAGDSPSEDLDQRENPFPLSFLAIILVYLKVY